MKARPFMWGLAAALFVYLPTSAQANTELLLMQKNPDNWVMPARTYDNQRYSPLAQINKGNVADLKVAWTFSTGVLRGHEGAPLVIGNMMYVHTPTPSNGNPGFANNTSNVVYALDMDKGAAIVWEYRHADEVFYKTKAGVVRTTVETMCCDNVNRGLSYADGKIFLYRADARLVALNAKTGKVEWEVKNAEPSEGATGTSAPHVFSDKVMVGVSGGEFAVRGHMTAYNVSDGKLAWRAYSMGPDSDTLVDKRTTELGKSVGKNSSLKTWKDGPTKSAEWLWQHGGGTTWGWYSFDPKLNLMYYGSGNPGSWNPTLRPGKNKWSMTIFARDVDTGHAKWVYQMTPHDEWDFDGVNEMILADDVMVRGKPRDVVVHFDRNGFGYTLDRASGELLVAEKFDPAVNWATKIDLKSGLPVLDPRYSTGKKGKGEEVNTLNVCPAALGSKDEQPAAYSPLTGLFYVPTNHVCMTYEPLGEEVQPYYPGGPFIHARLTMFPAGRVLGDGSTNMGRFVAWDAGTGQEAWAIDEPWSVWSGALATGGRLVFYGTLDGYLKAVDDRSGTELYRFKMPSGIIGNVMTFSYRGKQHLAVFSGIGGWAGIGLAANLTEPEAGLGAVGGYAGLSQLVKLGGTLFVFSL